MLLRRAMLEPAAPDDQPTSQNPKNPKGAMVEISNVMPMIPVVDLSVASAWYERSFRRPADRAPMSELAEWDLGPGSGIQIWIDAAKAGKTMATLTITSLAATQSAISERGLTLVSEQDADTVRLAAYADPDGNQITVIEPR